LVLLPPQSLTCFPATPTTTTNLHSTNTSYQRWDEARKMWGSMVNRSRDFTRQALGYVPESQPELRSMLVRWSITYP
jgi:predicted membrane chloride channel (bestrophin family)